MRYTQNVAEFVRSNQTEVKRLVTRICSDFSVPDYVDDVTQILYLKFLTRKTLESFDPNHAGSPKISTYLFKVVTNLVKALKADKENYMERNKYRSINEDPSRMYRDDYYVDDDIEFAIHTEGMNPDYEGNLYANYTIEPVDGLEFDLNLFEKYLKSSNRHFNLNRRRCKSVKSKGLSLMDVFQYMRQGYTNRDIALKYGTSVTFITSLKLEIKLLMVKFGFIYGPQHKCRLYSKIFSAG